MPKWCGCGRFVPRLTCGVDRYDSLRRSPGCCARPRDVRRLRVGAFTADPCAAGGWDCGYIAVPFLPSDEDPGALVELSDPPASSPLVAARRRGIPGGRRRGRRPFELPWRSGGRASGQEQRKTSRQASDLHSVPSSFSVFVAGVGARGLVLARHSRLTLASS